MIGQRVKITVLKRLQLAEELGVQMMPPEGGGDPGGSDGPGGPGGPGGPDGAGGGMPPCHAFYEGQEIFYQLGGGGVPEGFCDWAWNDIFKDVMAVCSRAAMVPADQRSQVEPSYTCCTDGLRPVIFKIEAV